MRKAKSIELAFILMNIFILVFFLRDALVFGYTTFVHDNYYWNFPTFHFFADNILHGKFPLWNPYSHGGEPFYPILGQMRFLDPIFIISVYFTHFFTDSTILLFNWQRIFVSLFMALGVGLLFREFTKHLVIRLMLVPLLLFTSFFLGSFRADGILNHFLWTPYIGLFLKQIVWNGDNRWRKWLALTGAIGVNLQAYFLVFPLLFTGLFVLGTFLWDRKKVLNLFRSKDFWKKPIWCGLLLAVMALPNLVLLNEQNQFTFPVRSAPSNYAALEPRNGSLGIETSEDEDGTNALGLSLDSINYFGTFSNLWNVAQLLRPESNFKLVETSPNANLWGKPSEAYIYIGLLGWLVVLVGMLFGVAKLKRIWVFITVVFVFLSLGPTGIGYSVLYYTYPLLRFVRHGALSVLFVELGLLYFFVLGAKELIFNRKIFHFPISLRSSLEALIFSLLLVLIVGAYLVPLNDLQFFLPVVLSLSIIIGFVFYRRLPKQLFTLSIVTAQMVLIFALDRRPFEFAVELGVLLVLPVLILIYISKINLNPRIKRRFSALVILLFLSIDGLMHIEKVKAIFRLTPNLDDKTGQLFKIMRPSPPTTRKTVSEIPFFTGITHVQNNRYPELIERSRVCLSSIYRVDTDYAVALKFGRVPKLSSHTANPWKETRSDSMFLLRSYHKLLYSKLPVDVLENFFFVGGPMFDFRNSVSEKSAREEAAFSFQFDKYSHSNMTVSLYNNKPGFFYWPDGYDPNWVATLDGKDVPILRANTHFKAIQLPAGRHQLILRYWPLNYMLALLLFYLALGVCWGPSLYFSAVMVTKHVFFE